jgi:hypothetical protein
MVDVASRATNGVKVPDRRQTRQEILDLFKRQMAHLKEKLNVCIHSLLWYILIDILVQSTTVSGDINLTCDAWQASNVNGYFAVTGSWIEEKTPNKWELETTLLGFVQLNNSHNGVRLGQALFKVVSRIGIEHKVRTKRVLLNAHPYALVYAI